MVKRYSHFYRMGRAARRNGKAIEECKLHSEALNAWRCGWYDMDMDLYHANQGPCDGVDQEVQD
jgi:hypothetical protein